MPQMTLFAPDITCDHCIATISKAVATVEGARFIAGDPDSRTFAVEVASGAVLDRVAETLAGEGYDIDVQTITMPWGQPLEAAQAVAKG